MRPQALKILGDLLNDAPNIALVLGIPAASVRRSIQEIIAHGHNVTYANETFSRDGSPKHKSLLPTTNEAFSGE